MRRLLEPRQGMLCDIGWVLPMWSIVSLVSFVVMYVVIFVGMIVEGWRDWMVVVIGVVPFMCLPAYISDIEWMYVIGHCVGLIGISVRTVVERELTVIWLFCVVCYISGVATTMRRQQQQQRRRSGVV